MWKDVSVFENDSRNALITVTLNVDLPTNSALSNWFINVQTQENSETPIGIWEAIISIPSSAGKGSNGELFFPSGYGETYIDPVKTTGGSVSGLYPSGEDRCLCLCCIHSFECIVDVKGGVSMQFMAVADMSNSENESSSGVYLGTPDASGSIKGLQLNVL